VRDCNYIIRYVHRIVEVKKSKSADINNNRATWFLLGLVFVLSVLFVVLEYTASDESASDDEELLEDMSLDTEIYPSLDMKSFKSFMASSADKRSHDKLKIVENEEQTTAATDIKDENAQAAEYSETVSTSEAETTDGAQTSADGGGDKPLDFRVVEQIPEFPGGMGAFIKWLSANLKYPESAKNRKIQGKVVVSFIVNKDGSISDEKVMKGINPLLDREALRVIKLMPKWKPGVENDKPCRTLFAIPIVFKI
jgi:protein TonB